MEYITGQTLIRKNKEEVSADEALKDKEFIVFYFSAEWCGPCQVFTPILAKCYEEAKEKNFPMEVIFVTSDEDEETFFKYMNSDHGDWLAVPFGSPIIQKIKEKFEVEWIPSYEITKKDGTVIPSEHHSVVEEKGFSAFEEWCK